MQERRCNGDEKLTDRASMKEFLEAISNPENEMVAAHKPGGRFTTADGREMVVNAAGEAVETRASRRRRERAAEKARRRRGHP